MGAARRRGDGGRRGGSAVGIVLEELEIGLSGVVGELAGQAEEPEAKPLGLGPAPAAGQGHGTERMQQLVGERAHAPEQSVAPEVRAWIPSMLVSTCAVGPVS